MNAQLTLRYQFSSDPGDDFGWLAVSVKTETFAGRGGFWVQYQNLEEWSVKLRVFSSSADTPCIEEWGQCDGDGSNYEVIIGVSILPVSKTGNLDVIVRIADNHDTRRHCQAVFRTNYAQTAQFAADLQGLMRREKDEAVLLGRDLG